jgi:hypothetical protein
MIINLKYMFYYEISLKIGSQIMQGGFYNSISFNKNIILKFFKEKFSTLSDLFFYEDNKIEEVDENAMDVCFENYILPSNKSKGGDMDSFHMKTRIEILNILSFLLDNYQDNEIINPDIKKFICDLLDVMIDNQDKLIENIKQICNKF